MDAVIFDRLGYIALIVVMIAARWKLKRRWAGDASRSADWVSVVATFTLWLELALAIVAFVVWLEDRQAGLALLRQPWWIIVRIAAMTCWLWWAADLLAARAVRRRV